MGPLLPAAVAEAASGPEAGPDAGLGADPAASDPEARRLRWRCRRGLKELDLLLERFAREALPAASREERGVLAELLALPDPLLAEYLLGEVTPDDPALARLVECIRALCRSRERSALSSG